MTTRMLFADFDRIPDAFGGKRGSWKVFRSMLQAKVGVNGVVFTTFSGKAKVGFLFKTTTAKSAAIAEMASILGEDVLQVC